MLLERCCQWEVVAGLFSVEYYVTVEVILFLVSPAFHFLLKSWNALLQIMNT